MPQRPRTAFLTPSKNTTAKSVFEALENAEIDATEIACLQRTMNGEVTVTFKSISAKEKFLRLNSLEVDAEHFALQDVDKPLTFLTIYDAPFELSDLAIIKRLWPYCEVLHYRWGKHSLAPNIYNGLRHYRVRISKPIPSFLRFGNFQVFVKHSSQVPTCRKCNRPVMFVLTVCVLIVRVSAMRPVSVLVLFCAVCVRRKVIWGSIVHTRGSVLWSLQPTSRTMSR